MAELYEDDDDTREGWLMWAIELARRGLRPPGEIVVHGPHPGADYMWGEAVCEDPSAPPSHNLVEVEFRSGRVRVMGGKAIWDLHDLRVQTKDEPEERWPLQRMRDLPADLRTWTAAARKERTRLRDSARRSAEEARAWRDRWRKDAR